MFPAPHLGIQQGLARHGIALRALNSVLQTASKGSKFSLFIDGATKLCTVFMSMYHHCNGDLGMFYQIQHHFFGFGLICVLRKRYSRTVNTGPCQGHHG